MKMQLSILRSQSGSSLIEVAVALPVLLLILTGIVDFGRAYYYANEVEGAAHAGAVYGTQFPTNTANMVAAATANAPDVSGISATASYGCECQDGTNASASCTSTPSCTTNIVYYVTVTAAASFHPLLPWPGIPNPINITHSVTMRSGIG